MPIKRFPIIAYTLAVLATVTFLMGTATTAQATLIYSQSVLNSGHLGLTSRTTAGTSRAFDDFTLGADATLDVVSWSGAYFVTNTPVTESIVVSIHADNAGQPNLAVLSSTTASVSGIDSGSNVSFSGTNYDVYNFSMDVTDFALTAGTTYWLSIATLTNTSNFTWSRASDGNLVGGQSSNSGGSWQSFNGNANLADAMFTLESADAVVNSPAPLALVALSLVGLLRQRRR